VCTLYTLGIIAIILVGSLKKNTTLEYSTRVVQEGDRRCEKSTLNDLAYLTALRIPLMNPVYVFVHILCDGGFSVREIIMSLNFSSN
jgi:hypothetical protein